MSHCFITSLQEIIRLYPQYIIQVQDHAFLIRDFSGFKAMFDRGEAPFGHSNYASFNRQLNKYGFCYQASKITRTPRKWKHYTKNTRYYAQRELIPISNVTQLIQYRHDHDSRVIHQCKPFVVK